MSDETRLERTTHTVGGDRARLHLEAGAIVITKSATSQTDASEVEVPLDRVRSVEVQRPSRGASGWLHLAVVDGSPAPVTELAAMSDPYTIPLTSRQVPAARRLERMVGDHVQRRGLPAASPSDTAHRATSGVTLTHAPTSPTPPAVRTAAPAPETVTVSTAVDGEEDLTAKLRELAELHRSGALDDEEFRRAKQAILGG